MRIKRQLQRINTSYDEFYLAAGNAADGKLNKNVPYYKVEMNIFTGRSKLTYKED